MLGIRTAGRLETFDIVFHPTTIGAAEADDSPDFATVYKRHVLQSAGLRSEGDQSDFLVLEPAVNPHQRGILIEFDGEGKGHAVLCLVRGVLRGIELDSHVYCSYSKERYQATLRSPAVGSEPSVVLQDRVTGGEALTG
jgi:hypothetical protein